MNLKEFINTRMTSYSQSLSNFNPKTIKIGNQEWMLENLAIDDGKGGIIVWSGNHYYTWDAAMRVAAGVKGWHLPTRSECKDLIDSDKDFLKKLDFKSIGYYISQFHADPGGFNAYWTSTDFGDTEYADILFNKNMESRVTLIKKLIGCPVRLVKD